MFPPDGGRTKSGPFDPDPETVRATFDLIWDEFQVPLLCRGYLGCRRELDPRAWTWAIGRVAERVLEGHPPPRTIDYLKATARDWTPEIGARDAAEDEDEVIPEDPHAGWSDEQRAAFADFRRQAAADREARAQARQAAREQRGKTWQVLQQEGREIASGDKLLPLGRSLESLGRMPA